MAIIKCKMCGGDLTLVEGQSVAECEYCGSRQTVPAADNEKKLTLFSRANRLRASCEFDKAAGIYESVVADFPEEAEAYWGLVLCKFGIEYVDDPATGKKIPTCHRSSYDSVLDDGDFEQALENADVVARKVYREEAKQIEEIRKGIIAVSSNEEPYDIFICYKETDETGSRTLDSVLAQDIYDTLTDKGYRTFFARITLEDKLGMEYEPYIFAALNSAKVMLAVGTDYEYYNAVWVKNEWSRYLKLMATDKEKHLIPCYKGIDAYDMPKEFARLQAQDLGKVGAMQDLLRGIGKILHNETQPVVQARPSANSNAMVMRGQFALDDGDFTKADEYFDRALDQNATDGQAYLGKVLAALHLSRAEQINDLLIKVDTFKDFDRAIQFSDPALSAELKEIRENAEKKFLVKCLTVGLRNAAKKKERKETHESIKALIKTATAEGYEKAINLYQAAYNRGVSKADYSYDGLQSLKWQRDIICVLQDGQEHTTADIKKRIEANSRYVFSTSVLVSALNCMIKDGSVEARRVFEGAYYSVKGSAEKREAAYRESKYRRAVSIAQSAEDVLTENRYYQAADIFAALGDYLDSAEKYQECKMQGGLQQNRIRAEAERREQLRREIEAEQARIEAERKAEQARIEAEHRAKRKAELEKEKASLETERANLKGLFSGKRRKEIEARLAEIEYNLKNL